MMTTRAMKWETGGRLCRLLAFAAMCGCSVPAGNEPRDAPRQPAAPREPRETTRSESQAPSSAAPAATRDRVRSGRLYVPVYSHIYTKEGTPEDLAITISVRNVSPTRSLILESVEYYSTAGTLLEHFLESQAEIGPFETVEFFIGTRDRRGGSGANVIVSWHADSPVLKPLVEAVMVRSVTTNQAYAFSTRAIEVPADADLPLDAPERPVVSPR